ncbi:flp pilus-assembly TadE/G-like family protein [Streptomyces sp. WAC 00631]|uniref:Rv3654c family TadE-like protein n=1 Tax=unclassified Streptomyces TaxID=2593676 RepID=UPI00163C22F1|nr:MULTISPECIES: Rv3654c family TadE-like protein [unclassified Streptomyces]MCC5032175.1 flp pilus-assembly TadE/G-like family protein [Streptomyces sp. WAC 00631]
MRAGGTPDADRGSATVWTAVTATALCAVFAAVLALGQAVVTRHRAGGGADLAALAAADHALSGQDAACGLARRVAEAQGVRLVRCVVRGEVSDVTAEATTGPFASRVRARAGPADHLVGGAHPERDGPGRPRERIPGSGGG